jgi:hypothetical protein
MAKRIKDLLSEQKFAASLIHSMFTFEDRNFKEHDRDKGILNNQKGTKTNLK